MTVLQRVALLALVLLHRAQRDTGRSWERSREAARPRRCGEMWGDRGRSLHLLVAREVLRGEKGVEALEQPIRPLGGVIGGG